MACLGVAAAVQLVVVNYWPHFPSPNERSRAYQAIAIVSRASLSIDAEVKRYGGMEDLAVFGGRLYPNKAPGTLPLVVPAALVARAAAGGSPERELAITLVLGRLLASSLPLLLAALLLAHYLAAASSRGATLAVIAFAVASPALTSSLLLFSHSLVAFLLFGAFVLLFAAPQPGRWLAAAAGLGIGWAVTAEYPAIVPGAVLVALAATRLRLAGVLALAAGGAAPALALAAYNQVCFGSPLALSSGHEAHVAYVSLAERGLFGVGMPSLAAIAGLLTSPERGVLVWMPLLVLAGAGLRRTTSGADDRLALALVPIALLLAMAGYPNWHGGWFAGPRYLLPVLPFAVVLAGRGADRLMATTLGRVLAGAAALWGLALTWLSLASFPFPPEDYPLPALTFSLPLLRVGVSVPSWLPHGVTAFILAGLLTAAAFLLCGTACRRRREVVAALALAATALTLAATRAAPTTWQARLEWAVVHDVYAGAADADALERLAPSCTSAGQRTQLQWWLAERGAVRAAPRD
jgi:hypothetical protein